jgi:AcrR family transcriptional regulator
MSQQATLERPGEAHGEEAGAKRRQIIDGARQVFLTKGFDAASMNDIARAAGVSKGTLYVYFNDKEQLFEAIVDQECEAQAEGIFELDPHDRDVEAALKRVGVAFVKFLCRPEKASAIRTVIAIADRMPELGRKFYEKGPGKGIALLAGYLSAQVDAGEIAVEDCEIAAAQFIETCHAMLFKPVLFNFAPAPSPEQIERNVRIAVASFLAAHRARPRS